MSKKELYSILLVWLLLMVFSYIELMIRDVFLFILGFSIVNFFVSLNLCFLFIKKGFAKFPIFIGVLICFFTYKEIYKNYGIDYQGKIFNGETIYQISKNKSNAIHSILQIKNPAALNHLDEIAQKSRYAQAANEYYLTFSFLKQVETSTKELDEYEKALLRNIPKSIIKNYLERKEKVRLQRIADIKGEELGLYRDLKDFL